MFTESATVRRINNQCRIWLHKPSGVKYSKGVSNGVSTYMQPISGPAKTVTDDELNNHKIWSQV